MMKPMMNTGVGSLSLLQGIFPTQGLNPGFSHCRWIRYQLSHQGRPFPGGSDGSVYLQCGGWWAAVHGITKELDMT